MSKQLSSSISAITNDPVTGSFAAEGLTAGHRILIAAGLLAAMVMTNARAHAHDAPSGWSYPYSCCSNQDCRPVATRAVSEKSQGYVINVTGEVVPYADVRVRTSPDGDFHWCSVAGGEKSRTICLFVPPRSF